MKPKNENGKPDTRYTITTEHTGHVVAQHVARWCGLRIGADTVKAGAWELCRDHQRARLQSDATA
jgi:hypothetical protein